MASEQGYQILPKDFYEKTSNDIGSPRGTASTSPTMEGISSTVSPSLTINTILLRSTSSIQPRHLLDEKSVHLYEQDGCSSASVTPPATPSKEAVTLGRWGRLRNAIVEAIQRRRQIPRRNSRTSLAEDAQDGENRILDNNSNDPGETSFTFGHERPPRNPLTNRGPKAWSDGDDVVGKPGDYDCFAQFAAAGFYIICAVTMVSLNKLLLSTYELGHSIIVLVLCQEIITVTCVTASRFFTNFPDVNVRLLILLR